MNFKNPNEKDAAKETTLYNNNENILLGNKRKRNIFTYFNTDSKNKNIKSINQKKFKTLEFSHNNMEYIINYELENDKEKLYFVFFEGNIPKVRTFNNLEEIDIEKDGYIFFQKTTEKINSYIEMKSKSSNDIGLSTINKENQIDKVNTKFKEEEEEESNIDAKSDSNKAIKKRKNKNLLKEEKGNNYLKQKAKNRKNIDNKIFNTGEIESENESRDLINRNNENQKQNLVKSNKNDNEVNKEILFNDIYEELNINNKEKKKKIKIDKLVDDESKESFINETSIKEVTNKLGYYIKYNLERGTKEKVYKYFYQYMNNKRRFKVLLAEDLRNIMHVVFIFIDDKIRITEELENFFKIDSINPELIKKINSKYEIILLSKLDVNCIANFDLDEIREDEDFDTGIIIKTSEMFVNYCNFKTIYKIFNNCRIKNIFSLKDIIDMFNLNNNLPNIFKNIIWIFPSSPIIENITKIKCGNNVIILTLKYPNDKAILLSDKTNKLITDKIIILSSCSFEDYYIRYPFEKELLKSKITELEIIFSCLNIIDYNYICKINELD